MSKTNLGIIIAICCIIVVIIGLGVHTLMNPTIPDRREYIGELSYIQYQVNGFGEVLETDLHFADAAVWSLNGFYVFQLNATYKVTYDFYDYGHPLVGQENRTIVVSVEELKP